MIDQIVNKVLEHPKILELRAQVKEILELAREIRGAHK